MPLIPSLRRLRGPLALSLATWGTTLTVAPRAALAQEVDGATRSAARSLGTEGVQAYQAGDFATATERLERAYRVLRVASLGLWSARALEKNGRLIEASERFLEASRLPIDKGGDVGVQEKAQRDALKEHDDIQARIPSLVIVLVGADVNEARVTIDGKPVNNALLGAAVPSNPGSVEIVAVVGNKAVTGRATLAEGQKKEVRLDWATARSTGERTPQAEPTAKKEPPPQHLQEAPTSDGSSLHGVVAWSAVGLGSVGLALGGVFGGMAIGQRNDLDEVCNEGACPPSQSDEVASYNSMRTYSTIGFIAGGVLAATGVTLLLTAPSAQASASAYWGPTEAGVRGTF